MHVMVRESWTDQRLDEFGKRVDERFDRVDQRFNEVDAKFKDVDKRLDKIDSRLESMQKTMILGVIAMSSAYIAGFAALVTQI
jgi:tetrahydromethanopterin S-methyltransferase subunit G